ncbi:benzoate/H(+) symporter BenE family transporter [Microbulbifer sp. JMSA008]|uniref:benzoate/H(+) symporter BenE family transporter n=1 Tax=Microbulbifer sp. JMSA008 TaxID=3243373 RepID=UPI00403A0789
MEKVYILRSLLSDTSLSTISAGFIAVLVAVTSSAAIVFEAARTAGADEAMIASWIGALGLGMGLSGIIFSWYYRAPIVTAWSTPGAALLATSLSGIPIAEAIGAFFFSAMLTLLVGLSGAFERVARLVPGPIAGAMLAGILLQFGLATFTSLQSQPVLVGAMLLAYFIGRRWIPRYAIILVLACGVAVCWKLQLFAPDQIHWQAAKPIWVTPEFKLSTLISVGIPLFIVTMTSQYLPGAATLAASGYQRVPVSPLISGTGLTNLLLTPFGGFTLTLASITGAICTGPEAHPNPDKRYTAGIAAGFFYLLVGLSGATVVALFSNFPKALIAGLAGLALLGTLGNCLASATTDTENREAVLITFLVSASGISFLGIGAAFWGLVGGLGCYWFFKQDNK